MNENLRALIEQSTIYIEPAVDSGEGWIFNKEKFAELIVQRALAIVDSHAEVFQTDRDRAVIDHIKYSIKTDFGVKQ